MAALLAPAAQHHGNLSIGFDGGTFHLVRVKAATGAQSGLHVFARQQFLPHQVLVDFPLVNQYLGLAIHPVAYARKVKRQPRQR